jgi:hypothetical protein
MICKRGFKTGQGQGSKGRDGGGDLTNVQCTIFQYNESSMYNEYILILKIIIKNKQQQQK